MSGAVDARTEDGDISAEMYSGSGGASKFFTRDGDLEILFAQTLQKQLLMQKSQVLGSMKMMSHSLQIFLPVNDKNKLAAKYEINGGGDSILLEAVNGEIYIKKLVAETTASSKENKSVIT